METNLADFIRDTPEGREADAILRKCVHCGFCTATCPTYQLLGDELDGPRGRIYLMKQVLEGKPATVKTQLHLDRCLTCRVVRNHLPFRGAVRAAVDIGRNLSSMPRSGAAPEKRLRAARCAPRFRARRLFHRCSSSGQFARPFLLGALKRKIPPPARATGAGRLRAHARKMLVLDGCVQPCLSPNTTRQQRACSTGWASRWCAPRQPAAAARFRST